MNTHMIRLAAVALALALPASAQQLGNGLDLSGPAPAVDGARMVDLDDVVTRMTARGANDLAAVQRLDVLLTGRPRTALGIPTLLRRGDLEESVSSRLVHGLERSGTRLAQKVLADVAADPGMRQMDRLRAVIASAGLQDPGPKSTQALWELTAHRESKGAADVANTALLALGSQAAVMRLGEQPKLKAYGKLRDRLIATLHASGDLVERSIVLKALANTGDPDLAVVVAPYLSAESVQERVSAAQALGRVGDETSVPLLVDGLVAEPRGVVRAEMVRSLGALPVTGDDIARIEAAVVVEPHPTAREHMTTLLVQRLDLRPEAQATLAHLAEVDESEAVRNIAAGAVDR